MSLLSHSASTASLPSSSSRYGSSSRGNVQSAHSFSRSSHSSSSSPSLLAPRSLASSQSLSSLPPHSSSSSFSPSLSNELVPFSIAAEDDTANLLRVQRAQIDKLKSDNERLKDELAMDTRQARLINNHSASRDISRLQDEGDYYTRKIEQEKRKIDELDKQISKMNAAIDSHRKQLGGVNASKEANETTQKQIRILENRLDKALVKFNEALANNKSLREQIDNLRRERAVWDSIYAKLERELEEKKEKINDYMALSASIHESRDQAQLSMLHMKMKADKQQEMFENEWNELGSLMERDRQMKEELKEKEMQRALKVFNPNADSSLAHAYSQSLELESKLKKKLSKAAWSVAKERAAIEQAQNKVRDFEDAFAKIQRATKIGDIDELVGCFVGAEERNFELFNEVNELSKEIERREEKLEEMRREIEELSSEEKQTDFQRKAILQEMNKKLHSTAASSHTFHNKHERALNTVHSLKQGIQTLFSTLAAASSPSSSSSSSPSSSSSLASLPPMKMGEALTESNMLTYLGAIEVRINDLLSLFVRQREEEAAETKRIEEEEAMIAKLQRDIVKKNKENEEEEGYIDHDEEEEDNGRGGGRMNGRGGGGVKAEMIERMINKQLHTEKAKEARHEDEEEGEKGEEETKEEEEKTSDTAAAEEEEYSDDAEEEGSSPPPSAPSSSLPVNKNKQSNGTSSSSRRDVDSDEDDKKEKPPMSLAAINSLFEEMGEGEGQQSKEEKEREKKAEAPESPEPQVADEFGENEASDQRM